MEMADESWYIASGRIRYSRLFHLHLPDQSIRESKLEQEVKL